MADPHHLKLLTQNVADWSAWREKHPEVTPDLSETCLYGAYHGGLDLRNINLSGADLHQAEVALRSSRTEAIRPRTSFSSQLNDETRAQGSMDRAAEQTLLASFARL